MNHIDQNVRQLFMAFFARRQALAFRSIDQASWPGTSSNHGRVAAIAVCLLLMVVTGCGTPRPIKSYVRRGPSYSTTMPTVDRMGVLVDAVVIYDRVSTNYYVVEDSLSAIASLTQEVANNLKAKGYDLAFVDSPLVGGFEPPESRFAVASNRKDVPSLLPAPFKSSQELDSDPAYRDALVSAARLIHEAVRNRGELPTEQLRASEGAHPALASIAAKKKVRYLLLVQGDGTIVSGGKQVGQEIGTALVSTFLTLGAVTASAHNISLLNTTVSLIDLENSEVLWCNSLGLGGLNPANPDHYKSRWAQQVLYWLPPRGQLEPPMLQR